MRPSPRAASGPSASDAAQAFAAIADCVEADGSAEQVIARLRAAWSQCDRAASARSAGDAQHRLSNVQQALETWQRVWPRLGSQREFRAAVIREARLWAKTLS